MNRCTHAKALLLALVGVISVVLAAEGEAQSSASPPMTLERRDALEVASSDPTLAPWQRQIMRHVAQGTSQLQTAPSPRHVVGSSQRIFAAAGGDGEWNGILPSGLFGHTAIYDPVRNRMVVFGGFDVGHRNEVWILSLSGSPAWSALEPSGSPPPGRYGHTAIYDSLRDRIVVFGGEGEASSYRNDVWVLTLAESPEWSEIHPSGGMPSGRSEHSAIYDSVRDRMIVFGGRDVSSSHNDVWEVTLSGSPAWSELAPSGSSPLERSGHTAIYDATRDRMVVFGGDGRNDVWALTLSGTPAWTEIEPSGTIPGRTAHTAFYDAMRDRMVVFGGHDNGGYQNDVWALTLSETPAWSALLPSGAPPSVRGHHTAIYDPIRDQMVVFGGHGHGGSSYRNDAWALTLSGNTAWNIVTPPGTVPAGRDRHTAVYDSMRDRMVVCGGTEGPGNPNDVWVLTLSGTPAWSVLTSLGNPPPGVAGPSAIYDPIRDRLLLFGGYDGSYHNDVWELTLSGTPAWSALAPLGGPAPGRSFQTAIYDPVRDRMVVFAGGDGTHYLNDLWALTLSGIPTWSMLVPSGSLPMGRFAHSAIYDPVRDRMVMFAGYGASGVRDDVWALTLSGSIAWSPLAPLGSPPSARFGHTAIYDVKRDRMVAFGGYDFSTHPYLDDVWALTLSGSSAWSALAPSGSPPPARYGHTAIYDPVRDQMAVFGGFDGFVNPYRNDVWSLSWKFQVDDVEILDRRPRVFLHPTRPNPASSAAEVRYEIASDERVGLDVLDIQGRIVRRLRHSTQSAGQYSVMFDRRDDHGRDLAAGMYLIRLRTHSESRTTRVVILP